MKFNVVGLIAVANVLTVLPSSAQPSQKPNGCGPAGILGHFVPDEIRILNCKLKSSCDAHDTCYAKCLPGGALYKNPTCKDESAKRKRRQKCDADLYGMIVSSNRNNLACRGAASAYAGIVRVFGSGYFLGVMPLKHKREELYRAPPDYFQNVYLPTTKIMKRNYDAIQAFVRYAEAKPAGLSESEIDAAFASIAANYPGHNHVLEFRSSQTGAELIVKPLTPEWIDDDPKDEKVIWRGGR